MNHITLFGLATLGLVGVVAAADVFACDDELADTSGISTQIAAAPAEAATIMTFQFQPKAIETRAGTTVTYLDQ